jgi:mannose-6-phosphate isomerase-like protein (cupin superfamily)
VLYVTGVQKDSYQGIEMNLQADDNQMAVYYLGASSVVGDLAGTKIRVIDDSVDGVYGTVPKTFGNIGMSRDHYQPNMDSIVVGDAKRARPWSELQQIGGKWWSFDMQSDGRELSARQVAVDTGVLKLEYKGGVAPTWCVLKGEGQLQNCFFDIVEGGSKGVEVPTGRYTLYYGEVRKGKKRQQQKALIVPSKGMQNWDVRKGETTVVQLGAPFDFDFRTRLEEGVLTIEGASVVATGSAGERYERAWQCVPQVEAAWRKSGTKKASKAEKLPRVLDNDGINTLGWAAAWFPLDLQMEAKGVEKVEVQLVDKKHDLFGKVESAWKE